jgi:NADH-quinone oxidoreductase subunit A
MNAPSKHLFWHRALLDNPEPQPYSHFLDLRRAGQHDYNTTPDPRRNTMNQGYLSSYAPILIHLLIVVGLSAALIAVSWLIGERRPTRAKLTPYECGVLPTGDARQPFAVKFYLVAMLFILFDVEAIFLFPWAVVYRDLGMFGFVEMFLYILVLLAGYVYLWKKGALDWK